jgi:hypothetical protein
MDHQLLCSNRQTQCTVNVLVRFLYFQDLLFNLILRTNALIPCKHEMSVSPQEVHHVQDHAQSDPQLPQSEHHERFCRAVWELHSQVFLSYNQWLKTAQLPFLRSKKASNVLEVSSWTSSAALHVLLMELATYFLVCGM